MTSRNSEAAELKAQGVVEAAQDPNSSVTAEDAQKKIVQESKKAGVAAFEFDPDATPEQKAAQARAVSIIFMSITRSMGRGQRRGLSSLHSRMLDLED